MTSWSGLNTAYFTEDKDDHIYNALVRSIVEHQLLPGSKLPEEALAEVFSRPVKFSSAPTCRR